MDRDRDPWLRIFLKYRKELEGVGRSRPEFWDDVAIALRRTPVRVTTSEEAVVREVRVASATTQTIIAGLARGGAPKYSRGTQTDGRASPTVADLPGPRRSAPATPLPTRTRAPSRPPPTRNADVCWNCFAVNHRYSNCPYPKKRIFCFGCGRQGSTMRDCPACREEWLDLGPYHPDYGHMGKAEK